MKKKAIIAGSIVITVILLTTGIVLLMKHDTKDMADEAVQASVETSEAVSEPLSEAAETTAQLAEAENDSVLKETEAESIAEKADEAANMQTEEAEASLSTGTNVSENINYADFVKTYEEPPVVISSSKIQRDDKYESTEKDKKYVLWHKFEGTDISLYYYEYYSTELSSFDRVLKRMSLEYNGKFQDFNIDIFDDYIDESLHQFGCSDYDGDGELEISFVENFGEYSDDVFCNVFQKLYIFDYKKEIDAYDVYVLELNACQDTINNSIIDYYKETCGYEIDSSEFSDGYNSMMDGFYTWECEGFLDDETGVFWGERNKLNILDDVTMSVDVIVRKQKYEGVEMDGVIVYEPSRSYDDGALVCSIDYKGYGKFSINPLGFLKYGDE